MPSQKQYKNLLKNYQAERYDEAEKQALSMTHQFPEYQFGWKVLGAILKQTGRISESLFPFQKAVLLIPQDAEAHYNLVITLRDLGRLEEAEIVSRQVIALDPGYVNAHNNLGNILNELGKLEEAEACYRKAIMLKLDFAEAHNNLGNVLKDLGRLEESEVSYRKAIVLKNDFSEAYNNLGNVLKDLGILQEEEASYKQAICLMPGYAEAYYNLGAMHREQCRIDEAILNFRQVIALQPDSHSAKHILAALTGEKTATAPQDYVERLFDNYAAKFDNSLVDNLEYQTPKAISEMVLNNTKVNLLGSVMDLGCGTGLLGEEIKNFCGYLEGIDLSAKMLNEAKKKKIYNKLIKKDILTYLSTESLNFDYFVATDVFVYIGDLSDIFRLIKYRNKKGGKLVFSTEDYDGKDFCLRQTGRYSHSKRYIQNLCEQYGYQLSKFKTSNIRKDNNKYISGGLYLLDF